MNNQSQTCRECGSKLAVDQRYCLNCGARCGDPRIDFRQYESPVTPRSEEPTSAKPQRDYTPLAAVGGIAVLGVMLLIGVLIGKGDGGTATAPPPVVVQGGEAGSGEEATAAGEGGAGKPQASKAKSKSRGKDGRNDAASGGSSTGGAPVASDAQLQQLQEQSPDEYAENSAKLPDEIATGGAPPPEDGRAPGGGSKGTAIE
jgi:hypothetical protein